MEALSGMLKGWRAKQPFERISRTGDVDVKADIVKIETPDKANAFYFAGEIMPLRDDNPDYPALIIGNYISDRELAVIETWRPNPSERRFVVWCRLIADSQLA